jgi:hypothetical protein
VEWRNAPFAVCDTPVLPAQNSPPNSATHASRLLAPNKLAFNTKDIASILARTWDFERTQTAIRNDYSMHCEPKPDAARTSIWEIVGGAACAALLLTALILTGYAAYQWMEHEKQGVFDDLV